jgi:hypothetical protein
MTRCAVSAFWNFIIPKLGVQVGISRNDDVISFGRSVTWEEDAVVQILNLGRFEQVAVLGMAVGGHRKFPTAGKIRAFVGAFQIAVRVINANEAELGDCWTETPTPADGHQIIFLIM